MNLEHYKNFVTIVDTGTISGAAEKLLIAQPALSKQIQLLEEKYGAQLLIRKPRKVELTDAGKILYDKIKSIAYLEDAAQKEIDACVLGNRGTLWLGRTPSNPDRMFERLLLDFHTAYPEISFEIFEYNSHQLIELLRSGMIEIGLVRTQRYILPELKPELMTRESIMAYFHRAHPLMQQYPGEVPIEALKDCPISISNGIKNEFSLACESAGFHPNYLSKASSRALSMMWAADQKTVAIIISPEEFDEGEYCCRRIALQGMDTLRAFATLRGRRLSAVSENFLGFCKNHPLMEHWERED